MVGKVENTGNKHFLFFQKFSTLSKKKVTILTAVILWSPNAFRLNYFNTSTCISSGTELNLSIFGLYFMISEEVLGFLYVIKELKICT